MRRKPAIYWDRIRATFIGHEVKILAAYDSHGDLEGSPTEGTVIAELDRATTERVRAAMPVLAHRQLA